MCYLAEVSWTVLYEDACYTRKQLWRVNVHPMMQVYDAKVPCFRANIRHDFGTSHLVAGLDNEVKTPWPFSDSYPRLISCPMSEFSSPQMRCANMAAKYRTTELSIIQVMLLESTTRLLPRRSPAGFRRLMAQAPHSYCSAVHATPAQTRSAAVLT